MNSRYAFFDFDGTLIRSDSLLPFLHYISGRKFYYQLLKVSPVLISYLLRMMSNEQAKEKVLTTYIHGRDKNDLEYQANKFALEVIPQLLRTEGIEKLRFHQNREDYCVLVSASPEIYLIPWAKKYGFNDIIGTKLETKEGIYTGKIKGRNCYGRNKIQRIELRYGIGCWTDSYAYSDSSADMPLLKKSSHPYLLKNKKFKRI